MTTDKSEYDLQAEKFLADTGSTLSWVFSRFDFYFPGDTDKKAIWTFILSRGSRFYSSEFCDSLASSFKALTGRDLPHNWCLDDQSLYYENGKRLTISPKYRAFLKPPSAYSLLACLSSESYESIDDFISNFGFDPKTQKISEVIKTFEAANKQANALKLLYTDEELERLAEIA